MTAEGVKDEETLLLLKRIGRDLAQGHHICRPVPEAELREWSRATDWFVGRPPAPLWPPVPAVEP